MKFRLTPLNIITSLGFVFLGISFFEARPAGGLANINMGPFYKIILSSLILVSIVTDLIFRFIFIPFFQIVSFSFLMVCLPRYNEHEMNLSEPIKDDPSKSF